jgi:hypothetical protein
MMAVHSPNSGTLPQEDEPVFISLKGIEGLGRKSLAFLFSTRADKRFELEDDHPDAITIIDIDDFRGRAAWEEMKSQGPSRRPVILLGLEPMEEKGSIALQKPFRTREILAAIDSMMELQAQQLATATGESAPERAPPGDAVHSSPAVIDSSRRKPGLSTHAATSLNERELHAFIGSASDVDLDDPLALASVEYSPENFLAHRLGDLTRTAARERRYLRLSCCDAEFIIDPERRCIHTDVGERSLRSLGALPMAGENTAYRKLSQLPEGMETRSRCFAWDTFIWRMALASSRGRLPEGTSLDQRFTLRRWPNLTRLMLFPHATQISAAWVSAPLSIREILDQLSLPQRYLFAFFSAASATGLLVEAEAERSPSARNNTAGQPPAPRRGLFRRLLKTLYGKQGDNRA